MADKPTVVTYPLASTSRDFTIPFEYLTRQAVVVSILRSADMSFSRSLTLTDDFRFTSKTQITLNGDYSAWGDVIEIKRTTPTTRIVDYRDGSVLTASDLNVSQLQALHIAEEARYEISTQLDSTLETAQGYAASASASATAAEASYQKVQSVIVSAGESGTLARLTAEDGAEIIGYNKSTVAKDLNTKGVTTSSYGIGVEESDYLTDNSAAFQAMINAERYIIVDTRINLGQRIVSAFEHQVFSSAKGGHIRPINGTGNMQRAIMMTVGHKFVKFWRFNALNPLKLKEDLTGSSFGRQGAINIQADHCTIDDCLFMNQLNAVVAYSAGAPHGTTVMNSRFLDCLGTGQEDRGDAVTLWGSGNRIINNYASCLDGEDARLGFHIEGPVSAITNPRPQYDRMFSVMSGNMVYGKFRRHYAFENVTNGASVGNISLGGATWWGESYIQCANVYVNNQIYYTRTASDTQGSSWSPRRAAISVMNYSNDITIASTVIMATDAVGYGLTTGTTTGEHKFTFSGTLIDNSGIATNVGLDLIRPADAQIIGATIKGFATGSRPTIGATPAGATPRITFRNTTIVSSGAVFAEGFGSGGDLYATDCRFESTGALYPLSFANYTTVVLVGCGFNGTRGFAVSFGTPVTSKCYIKNCYNMNTANIAIRYNGGTSATMQDLDWDFSGNSGISHDFAYSAQQLSNKATKVNTIGKHTGRMVIAISGASRIPYVAIGQGDTATWRALGSVGSDITPA